MTHRLDVARGRDIVARWCVLAEQRLEYLTELFETGRWRRYHSEHAVLENIQEARSALKIWRDLSICEAAPDNSAVDISWLDRTMATQPRGERPRDPVDRPLPQPAAMPPKPPASDVSMPAAAGRVSPDQAPSVPDLAAPAMETPLHDVSALTPAVTAIAERYPLLRNAL
jgi:uncharacterized repeat protein (TIGR03809 family)